MRAGDVLADRQAHYAVKVVKKPGYKTVDENEEEYIMAAEL